VCFPGRGCIDEPPFGAQALNAITALTPASPAIMAGCFAVLGAALVLVAAGLRLQRRGAGVRPWLAGLIAALLLIGVIVARLISAWFATVSAAYRGIDGRPGVPPPPGLSGSWSLVLVAGGAMTTLGLVALLAASYTAVRRRRRPHRS
jgi:hypothetical protein